MQIPLFAPDSNWLPPDMSKLAAWPAGCRVALDVETCDPLLTKMGPGVRRGGYVVGVSFAVEDGPRAYLPIRHERGFNLPEKQVLRYLKDQIEGFKGVLVGANLSYDIDYLSEEGIDFSSVKRFRDVQVAEPLLDELQNSYSLDSIAKRHGLPGKNESLLRHAAEAFGVDPKGGLWRLEPKYVGAYAETDVALPLVLIRRQERMLEDQGLWPIYELESSLLPVLVKMRRRGVRVNFDKLSRIEQWSFAKETAALNEIHRLTGYQIGVGNVWNRAAVTRAIEEAGIATHFPRTADGNLSVTKQTLAEAQHPVAKLIIEARRSNKIRTTFATSVREHAVRGRVHTTFNQLRGTGGDNAEGDDGGGRFGRMSSKDPNLQQQPARDPEIGPMWRAVYEPDEGCLWASNDYSQQEPRWMVHYAELTGCRGAKEAGDRYRNDPKTDNHQMMAELTGIPRKRAKDIFLGRCYGMGDAKLCHTLGLPTEFTTNRQGKTIEVAGPEGRALIEQFESRVPWVPELAYRVMKAAEKGYIRTVLGRRCRFPALPDGGFDWTHKALNRLIQGSSADQTKKAMVDADEAGIPIQLQVHDEIDFSARTREEALALAEIMKKAVQCLVPSKVDVELGDSWGTAK